MPKSRTLADVLLRYGVAGAVNTGVGFAVVVVLEFVVGLSAAIANAGGFAAGLITAFFLNRSFVFLHQGRSRSAAARFVLAAGGAFVVNQAVLWFAGTELAAMPGGTVTAQALAILSYNVTLFIASRLWVFPAERTGA